MDFSPANEYDFFPFSHSTRKILMLPYNVKPIRHRYDELIIYALDEEGLDEQGVATSVDFFNEPLPKADVVTMSTILHDWNLERKKHLIQAAYDAPSEGGAFIAIENLIDDARRKNEMGLLMSLNMLMEFGDAFD